MSPTVFRQTAIFKSIILILQLFWPLKVECTNILASHKLGSHNLGSHKLGSHKLGLHKLGSHKLGSHKLGSLSC